MSDEAEADFKRTLELIGDQAGDRWLSFAQAVALIREREPMSIGEAEFTVDEARKSGKVRYHWFRDDGLLSKPTRGNTFVSEADLVSWHDKYRTSAPSHDEANARHKKAAEAIERTKQAIKAKCQNGPLALSKDMRNSIRVVHKVSYRTISRALKELRDEQPNRAK
jgi:hypothetical protein